jgi:hypothetical protein
MNLKECVAKILENFAAGDYFDSHTVIDALLTRPEYHLEYLRGYSRDSSVAQYHGNIAKMIGANEKVRPIGTAKTHSLYGDLSDNKLWQKT